MCFKRQFKNVKFKLQNTAVLPICDLVRLNMHQKIKSIKNINCFFMWGVPKEKICWSPVLELHLVPVGGLEIHRVHEVQLLSCHLCYGLGVMLDTIFIYFVNIHQTQRGDITFRKIEWFSV